MWFIAFTIPIFSYQILKWSMTNMQSYSLQLKFTKYGAARNGKWARNALWPSFWCTTVPQAWITNLWSYIHSSDSVHSDLIDLGLDGKDSRLHRPGSSHLVRGRQICCLDYPRPFRLCCDATSRKVSTDTEPNLTNAVYLCCHIMHSCPSLLCTSVF